MFWKRLLCIRKIPCVLEKTVVFPNRLLCSRKDCCVLKKIVALSKRLLCFRTGIELCFARMGHCTEETHPSRDADGYPIAGLDEEPTTNHMPST